MGRRSINTTKSGKYMNPTDQARKEARKRELKKNKKQRQMVRAAVLKGKDPSQIILEMEKMDLMEYNVECQPTLSEKVLKDKRKKLKETLDRVLKLYEKENPEYWVEIRRMEGDYEKKRQARIEYYEAVRHAQAVTVDEIPLPNLEMPPIPEPDSQPLPALNIEVGTPIPVPNTHMLPIHSILKKPPSLPTPTEPKKPPGCPPTLPPDFSDEEEEDDDEEDVEDKENDEEENEEEKEEAEGKKRKIRFADGEDSDEDKDTRITVKKSKSKNISSLPTKVFKMSGQDIDDFMRETEVLFKEKVAEKQADLLSRVEKIDEGTASAPNVQQAPTGGVVGQPPLRGPVPPPLMGLPLPAGVGAPTGPQSTSHSFPPFQAGAGSGAAADGSAAAQTNPSGHPGVPLSGIPPPLMLRPSLRGAVPIMPGMRMPMGPPMQGLPPRLPNMRLPPPMGLRPPLRPPIGVPGMHPHGMPVRAPPMGYNPNVLSAAPQLIARPKEDDKKSSATIEAKPQIRSLSADVTRFLPTALRVKREDKKKTSKQGTDTRDVPPSKPEEKDRKPTKDDAYSQFMQEMEGLL